MSPQHACFNTRRTIPGPIMGRDLLSTDIYGRVFLKKKNYLLKMDKALARLRYGMAHRP